jgi:hypothetical protein
MKLEQTIHFPEKKPYKIIERWSGVSRFMVFNATFNNISIITWRSVLLMERTGENHRPATSYWQIYHIMLYRVHLVWGGFKHTMLVVIGTDYIYSCTSNYHAIATTTSLVFILCVVFVNITLHKMEAVSIAPVFNG